MKEAGAGDFSPMVLHAHARLNGMRACYLGALWGWVIFVSL